jgi:hypothetical protein
MAFDAKGNPIGIVPDVEPTPMHQPIPEVELQINRKYNIEINKKVSPFLTIKKKYIGVLAELKSEINYGSYKFEHYKFKYLESLNKTDINDFEQRIDKPIFNGTKRGKNAFLKIYNASANEDILTLDQIKDMEEIDHKEGLIEGKTYYVRYVNRSGDALDRPDAFRGKYVGIINPVGREPSKYRFSNIVKIDTTISIYLDERTHITFFYTAEDLNETDRQRRVFASIFPHGELMVGGPSKRFGGNKRKTNRRKTNRRKTNKRKNKYA